MNSDSLATSAGWRLNSPRGIQREAPFTDLPATSTTTSRKNDSPSNKVLYCDHFFSGTWRITLAVDNANTKNIAWRNIKWKGWSVKRELIGNEADVTMTKPVNINPKEIHTSWRSNKASGDEVVIQCLVFASKCRICIPVGLSTHNVWLTQWKHRRAP